MKFSKVLTIALSAIAVAGFVGTATASAKPDTIVWCKASELECGKPFPNPTTIILHSSNPKFLSSVGTVECEKSLVEDTLLNKLGVILLSHPLKWTFDGNCHLGETSCTVTVGTLGSLEFTKTGASTANVKSNGGTTISTKCGSFINCTYGGNFLMESYSTEGGEAALVANKAVLSEGKGFLCPKTSELDSTYVAAGSMWLES